MHPCGMTSHRLALFLCPRLLDARSLGFFFSQELKDAAAFGFIGRAFKQLFEVLDILAVNEPAHRFHSPSKALQRRCCPVLTSQSNEMCCS